MRMSFSTRIMWSDRHVIRVDLNLIVAHTVNVAAVNESHLMLLSERRMPDAPQVEETNPDLRNGERGMNKCTTKTLLSPTRTRI